SLDEFHRREDPARLELTELLHANQSQMGRRRRDNRPASAQNSLRGVGRGGKPPGQQPYRDPVAGRLVLGKTHASKGARPQLADDPEATLNTRSEEHTSELQSRSDIVCRLLLEKKKKTQTTRRDSQTARINSQPPQM